MLKLTLENQIIDLPDLNRFRIGDHVIVDASADNDRFQGVIIGIEMNRRFSIGPLEPSITLLHDGYITDGFKPIDCRKVDLPSIAPISSGIAAEVQSDNVISGGECRGGQTDQPLASNLSAHPDLRGYQDRVSAAHHALFHDDPTDVAERVARFFEEAVETCQAFGLDFADAHHLVNYTYDRPVGEPAKEIGASLLTLASLCVVAGYDLMACGKADLEKLQRPETIARIRAKRSTRHGRGPLPGIDPDALRDAKEWTE